MRERFFTPRVRVSSYEELNALLLDQVIAYAKAHPHPEFKDRTVWQAFEAERPFLVPYAGRFDGFHAMPASVSKTCLVRFDNNRYSVAARAIGRPVAVRAYADRIELRQDGRVVGDHSRAFGRDQTVFDPWHYVPVLARKPGALRNGAPFKNWVLPNGIDRVRRKLASADDGDMVVISTYSGCAPNEQCHLKSMEVFLMRVIIACVALLAATFGVDAKYNYSSHPGQAAPVLNSMPAPGTLKTGDTVLVNDGTCPAGQIKQVTGGNPRVKLPRTIECVAR